MSNAPAPDKVKQHEVLYRQGMDEIKQQHEALYTQALEEGATLAQEGMERKIFLDKVKALLQKINAQAEAATSFDDYRWLNSAAIKWQVIYSSTLNLPETIQVALPRRLLPPTPTSALSEEELENYWLKRSAEFFAFLRIARGEEANWLQDAHLAKVFLASDILDGKLNFANRIAKDSYWRLEEIWLKEVKLLRAYFLYERRGGYNKPSDPVREKEDYYAVCKHLREMLVNTSGSTQGGINEGIKAQLAEFGQVRAYIEEKYLTHGEITHEKHSVVEMIRRKAERIQQTTGRGGDAHDSDNWVKAEAYIRMFYENIIPAVVKRDEEAILTVLKAFQYSKGVPDRNLRVVNCFEAVLATYFLDAKIIEQLWRQSEESPLPKSPVESWVEVSSWPRVKVPENCRRNFFFTGTRIYFRGLMTNAQRQALKRQASTGEQHAKLEDLYRLSRLIHRETTL